MDPLTVTYTVKSFDPITGEIEVQFDAGPIVPILLPVVNGLFPEAGELDALIRTYTPIYYYDRTSEVIAASNAAAIQALVTP